MPQPMPVWPLPYNVGVRHMLSPAPEAAALPARRRWAIVDAGMRRDVDEGEYRAALTSCDRIELARDPDEDVVTLLCYRNAT